jgi:hypothetical protein
MEKHACLDIILVGGYRYAPPKKLKCPLCGAVEHQRLLDFSRGVEVVIFKCAFVVPFKMHILESEKAKLMEKAKSEGLFEKWIRKEQQPDVLTI